MSSLREATKLSIEVTQAVRERFGEVSRTPDARHQVWAEVSNILLQRGSHARFSVAITPGGVIDVAASESIAYRPVRLRAVDGTGREQAAFADMLSQLYWTNGDRVPELVMSNGNWEVNWQV